MLRLCYYSILILFLTSCVHQQPDHSLKKPIVYTKTQQHRAIQSYTEIDVKGQINVTLHTGYKHPELTLTGNAIDLAQVKTEVRHSTLYISLGNGFPHHGPVCIDIKGPTLDSFRYQGKGIIKGTHLNTRYLALYINNEGTTQLGGTVGLSKLELKGTGPVFINGISSRDLRVRIEKNPKVQLVGFVTLCKLYIDGNSWLSMYWIRSYNLTVRARQAARIQLAGIVNRLDVELWGTSNFKGRFLRAQRSFVKTHDRSVAEISSVYHQSTLATDASDIYYYNIPTTRADFMAFNGSVLKLREYSPFDYQDFTRYNKQFP